MGAKMVFDDMDIRIHTLWVSSVGAPRFDAYQWHAGERFTEVSTYLTCADVPVVPQEYVYHSSRRTPDS